MFFRHGGCKMRKLDRPIYLNWLKKHRDERIIKVVTGVRRFGKSTIFGIYQDYLLSEGISPEQITSINFEDLGYEELTDYRHLYDYVSSRLCPGKMNYVFLDEIQHVAPYEKAVDSLFLKENCDVYISGSNAYLMSGGALNAPHGPTS